MFKDMPLEIFINNREKKKVNILQSFNNTKCYGHTIVK